MKLENDDLDTILSKVSKSIMEISYLVRKSSPLDLSSVLGNENPSGEQVKKLDIDSNNILKDNLSSVSTIKYLASEEDDNLIEVNKKGKYLVSFDPLDGSSNIDCNITVGTIFCVFEYNQNNKLINGGNIVMAGYSLYGGSTQLVVCKYGKVDIYNLDLLSDKWALIFTNYKMRDKGDIYSINESYKNIYDNKYNEYIDSLIEENYNMRWVGSLVADFHRTLIKGGVILYPSNKKNKKGKIRLVYEAYPLAYIIEKAEGMSFDGNVNSILNIPFPKDIHQRTPIFFGSEYEIFKLMF
jgi:fructose-1,6-bisphosphatase I